MKWIGLTGSIGCGKSTVAQFLKEYGVPVVDADEVSRFVTSKKGPGLEPIIKNFGKEVLDQGGEIDRRKLGDLVFSDKRKLSMLESILHPLIQKEVQSERKELEQKKFTFAVYDVPLLFEKKMQNDFDEIIVVSCSEEVRIERIKSRDKLSVAEIKKRMAAQVPLVDKIKGANYVIENNSGVGELKIKVIQLVNSLKKKYGFYQAQE